MKQVRVLADVRKLAWPYANAPVFYTARVVQTDTAPRRYPTETVEMIVHQEHILGELPTTGGYESRWILARPINFTLGGMLVEFLAPARVKLSPRAWEWY